MFPSNNIRSGGGRACRSDPDFSPDLQPFLNPNSILYTKLIYFFETSRVDRNLRLFFDEFQWEECDENLKNVCMDSCLPTSISGFHIHCYV